MPYDDIPRTGRPPSPDAAATTLRRQLAIVGIAFFTEFIIYFTTFGATAEFGFFGFFIIWPILHTITAIAAYLLIRKIDRIALAPLTAVIIAPFLYVASVAAHDVLYGWVRGMGLRRPWSGVETLFTSPHRFFDSLSDWPYLFSAGCVWLAFAIGGLQNRSRLRQRDDEHDVPRS